MDKEAVFKIMGKYYGNAYYRDAERLDFSEHDLRVTTDILNEINALGYYFSNLHRLTDHEDIRFVPIIFAHIRRYQSNSFRQGLLQGLCFRSYKSATPELLRLYDDPDFIAIRWDISDALYLLRDRKYIPDYLSVVQRPQYGNKSDMIMEILCLYKVKDVLPILLRLKDQNAFWTNLFLRYAHRFQDPQLLHEVEPYMDFPDSYTRSLAKKSIAAFHKRKP